MMDTKDIIELVATLMNSSRQGSELSEFAKIIALREMLQALKQPPQQLATSQDALWSNALQFMFAMKLFDIMEKKSGKSETDLDNFMKFIQLWNTLQGNKGQLDMLTLLQLMNQTHDRYAQLLKENYESKVKAVEESKKLTEEKIAQILDVVQKIVDRWDAEKIEMFKKFEETVSKLTEKEKFAELKQFLKEYQEFRTLEKQLKDLIKETELEKQPIVDEKGGINLDKLLHFIEKFIGASGNEAPPLREVVPPTSSYTTPVTTAPAQQTQSTTTAQVPVTPTYEELKKYEEQLKTNAEQSQSSGESPK